LYRRASTSTVEVQEFLNKTNKEIRKQLTDNEHQLKDEENKLNGLDSIIHDFRSKIDEEFEQMHKFDMKKNSLTKDIKLFTSQTIEFEREMQKPLKLIADKEKELNDTNNEIQTIEKNKLQSKIDGQAREENRLANLLEKVNASRQIKEFDLNSLVSSIKSKRDEIKILASKINKAENEIKQLGTNLEVKRKIKELKLEIDKNFKKLDVIKEQMDYLKKEKSKLLSELSRYESNPSAVKK